jgi:hypothetical protein
MWLGCRLRNLDRELFAQGGESRFYLAEPESMVEIERPVHLRQVPVQPAGEFRLATLEVRIAVERAWFLSMPAG